MTKTHAIHALPEGIEPLGLEQAHAIVGGFTEFSGGAVVAISLITIISNK